MFDNIKVGKQIAFLRKEKGFTQEYLAQKLGVSPQAISKWENGHTLPETILLPTLSELLDCSIDYILLSRDFPVKKKSENFEITLMPYKPVGKYTGSSWPHSMAYPSLFAALKLFMGLETRLNNMNRQINDDKEYTLQSVISTQAFGYSYTPDELSKDCFFIYGLDYERHKKADYSINEFISLATDNIKNGFPVIIEPKEYSELILATGFNSEGKILRGLGFIDGDDKKNSSFDFTKLNKYPDWFNNEVDLIIIKTTSSKLNLHQACLNALKTGYSMLSNQKHLKDLDTLFPYIFIYYESKLRLCEFLEQYIYEIDDFEKDIVSRLIDGYNKICENARDIIAIFNKTNNSSDNTHLEIINILNESRELELSLLKEFWSLLL